MTRHFARAAAVILSLSMLLIALGLPMPAHAQENFIGPREMLEIYYSYINAGRYDLAYQQWVTPPASYANFAGGYGDTSYVTAHFSGFQAAAANSPLGAVRGVLIGYRTNATVAAFTGCYQLRYNGDAAGMQRWTIVSANFQALGYVPNDQAVQALLATDCYAMTNADGSYATIQAMLTDHYDRINLGDFQGAYALWDNPQQTFDNFAQGWQDTSEVVLFYGAYQFSGRYDIAETGRVPVVLLGYHCDGSLVAYQGCIGVHFDANTYPYWGIWSAYLTPLPYGGPNNTAVAQAMNASCY